MTEPFTRLDPAPEVTIDKDKYVKTLKLLALRVPKVRHPTKRVAPRASCRHRRRALPSHNTFPTDALDHHPSAD